HIRNQEWISLSPACRLLLRDDEGLLAFQGLWRSVKEQVWSTSLMPNPLISMPLTSIISYKPETMLENSFVTTSSEISLFSVANRFIIGQHIASSHTLGPHNFGAMSIGQSLPSARNFPISTSRPQIEVVPHTFGATSLGKSLQPATPFLISTSPPQNEVVAPHHDIIFESKTFTPTRNCFSFITSLF
ncbi:hypothetical protein Fcan01_18735, partial [Folsomia candida]